MLCAPRCNNRWNYMFSRILGICCVALYVGASLFAGNAATQDYPTCFDLLARYQRALVAGFSHEEIQEDLRRKCLEAGLSDREIDEHVKYFRLPPGPARRASPYQRYLDAGLSPEEIQGVLRQRFGPSDRERREAEARLKEEVERLVKSAEDLGRLR